MYITFRNILVPFLILISLVTISCGRKIPSSASISGKAKIYPDYCDLTIPVNIAPLNFNIIEPADYYIVRFYSQAGREFYIHSGNGKITIPEKKWRSLLNQCKESKILIDIYYRKNGQWFRNEPIMNQVSSDSIDPCVAYRKIEPGYETWNKMGIFQRDLENFNESPVMINELSDGNCMNCHSFSAHNSGIMMLHIRAKHGGTIIARNGKLIKVNTKTDSTLSAGVYPSWHPGGRYIAFSVNHIVQSFHALPNHKVEVIDTVSDLILYDSELNCVIKNPVLSSSKRFETFPSWSPDGRYLYFCSADSQNYRDYQQIRYDLLRIPFDASAVTFGAVDTVIPAAKNGYSISFPRVSPDGKYLLFCKTAYGNFTIWHDDSDLVLLDLETGRTIVPDINSNKSESYHTWSSNGRWIVFSSRRGDGMYTRLYFSYFDKNGNLHKPFLLPQKDPESNAELLKSYNVPELVTSRIQLNPRILVPIINSDAVTATYKKSN
jgi:Tol biopolymer transport system component